jgi:hypothetical protein
MQGGTMRWAVITIGVLMLTACAMTPEQREAFAQALAGAAAAPAASTKLMIFGGDDHRTYLGCLNCSQYDSESISNTYGSFGSAYSTTSVHNSYSDYGSPYSSHSACNPYATDPPVIVDGGGNFYGRLTINSYNPQQTRDAGVLQWLAAVCEH